MPDLRGVLIQATWIQQAGHRFGGRRRAAQAGPDRRDVQVKPRDVSGHQPARHAGELGGGHHLRDVAIAVGCGKRGPDQVSGGQYGVDQRPVHPQQECGIPRCVRRAGNYVGAADMIMGAPNPRRGSHGRSAVAEGDCSEVLHGGGEPADGIPAPATVLIDTGHRQRVQRVHQQGPQGRHRRGQVSAHPPGDAGGPEKAVVPGVFRQTRRTWSRRTLDKAGRGRVQIRRVSQTTQLLRRRRA